MSGLLIALLGVGGYYLYKKITEEDQSKKNHYTYPRTKNSTHNYKAKPKKIYISETLEKQFNNTVKELEFYIHKIKEANSYLPLNQQAVIKSKFDIISKININHEFRNTVNKNKLIACKKFIDNFEKAIIQSHTNFTNKQITKYPNIFARGNKNHTFTQSRSIISDEESTLVVAGAGSGKTSTIIGRIYYLVYVKMIPPKNILVITYTKSASEELKKRLSQIQNIEVRTIHSLGRKILLQNSKLNTNNKKYSSTNYILKNDKEFSKFLSASLKRYAEKDDGEKLNKYFLNHLRPFKSRLDLSFKKFEDYVEYSKLAGSFKTLKKEFVKSYEELEIANFLAFNGIQYKYEQSYKYNTVGQDDNGLWRGQYKPDFYLPDYDLYIEHYALNKDNTPPKWFAVGYFEGVQWKRKLHQQYNTKCIETFSYEKIENNLLVNLALRLKNEGVVFKKQNKEDLLKVFNETRKVTFFDKLMQSFIAHYKSNELNIAELRKRTITRGLLDVFRLNAFIDIFEHVYSEYQNLILKDEHDFIDMVIESRKILSKQTHYLNYQHIIIDEFQDISTSTLNLISAVRHKTKSSKIFAVGDDWQSIFKFLGGNVEYFINFKDYFGNLDQIQLEETFRFHQYLADAANTFITQNPDQLRKTIKSILKPNPEIKIPIQIYLSSKSYQYIYMSNDPVSKVILELDEQERVDAQVEKILKLKKNPSIFVLGRYNNQSLSDHLSASYSDTDISYHTIHSAKGLEADYVILNNVRSGFKGFPSEMEDDPILKLVTNINAKESIANAEERRLLYVALTRARYRVIILADSLNQSSFIKELQKYPQVSTIQESEINLLECNKCKSGKMILFENSKDQSLFFSCQNRPICDNKFEYDELQHAKYLTSKAIKKLETKVEIEEL